MPIGVRNSAANHDGRETTHMLYGIECAKCGERIGNDERILFGPGQPFGSQRYHFSCVDLQTRLHPESLTEFHSWLIQKLWDENTMLRHKTDVLMRELTTILQAQGAEAQAIEDFQEEFRVYDERVESD